MTLNGDPVTFDNGVATIQVDSAVGTATITLTMAPPTIRATTATSTGLQLLPRREPHRPAHRIRHPGDRRSSCETPTATTSGVLPDADTGAPLRAPGHQIRTPVRAS
ncbi:MAG TPA: hypothetical protein VIU11_01980 [Nakamurella sp.]